jgi:hypothetical protein
VEGLPSTITDAKSARSAVDAGDLTVETQVVVNMPVVAWKGGACPSTRCSSSTWAGAS